MMTDPCRQYKQNEVGTATPGKLLMMLYNGALKNLKLSRAGMEENDYTKVNLYLGKTQDIVSELMYSLDLDQGDVARQLYALYGYMNRQLVEANVKKDVELIQEVEGLLAELRDTWKMALLQR